ncbi:hypothetical protein [Rhizobium leguminosarum]|uniref:hypothetical protein n=1 Tax=Rhizobium leguminosarum TaxID=384 RepID=UPI001C94D748|nr:hypothetical protein [Rhizobium leguminosarum]MBY5740188.1 hypothetical protein [Rhizobium leguminosarum]
MMKPWPLLVDHIRNVRKRSEDEKFSSALLGIEQLADFIAQGSLRDALFGWTSMADLCGQQTEHKPYSVAYLRISAQSSGLIEFRFIDTAVDRRQWTRTEPPERAVDRLRTFLDQLHWVSAPGQPHTRRSMR